MTNVIEINDHGLKQRMARFAKEFERVQNAAMDASLLILWENVPPYPAPPSDSTYIRTGTHGRKLGLDAGGGKSGTPSIYTKKKLGDGFEGRFGTNLEYSQYVIGDNTQAAIHQGRWYKMQDIANKSKDRILKLWNTAADKMAKFLDGKGL
jgi:hypothetical protein